jgi:DNA-binding NarL/FixJ family response regulator
LDWFDNLVGYRPTFGRLAGPVISPPEGCKIVVFHKEFVRKPKFLNDPILYFLRTNIDMIEILVVSDKEQDRNNIRLALSTQDDFGITGFGKDGYEALKLCADLKPDIVLIGLQGEDKDNPGLVLMIKRRSPSTAVIILGADNNEDYVYKVLSEGASGYVLNTTIGDKLCNAVKVVYEGGWYITEGILEKTFSRLADMVRYQKAYGYLTPLMKKHAIPSNISWTELRIISCIGQGQSIKEIAEQLHLARGTIRNCVSSAMRKTGMRSRTQIALFAIENNLVDSRDRPSPAARPDSRDHGH